MKRLITYLFTFVVVFGFCTQSIYATSAGTDETNNNSFVGFDENGNLIQYDPEELEEELASSMVSTVMLAEETKDVTYGVVNFRTKASANEITTYTNCTNGEQGYINGYMMSDGAYLGMVNGKVKFKAAVLLVWWMLVKFKLSIMQMLIQLVVIRQVVVLYIIMWRI